MTNEARPAKQVKKSDNNKISNSNNNSITSSSNTSFQSVHQSTIPSTAENTPTYSKFISKDDSSPTSTFYKSATSSQYSNFIMSQEQTTTTTTPTSSPNAQEWVSLNVGGTILTTTKTTLLKYSEGAHDHFLAKLISDSDASLPSRTDPNGAYLVDRNPEFFKHVINFLRNGRLDVPADHTLDGVLSEAEFCNLRELANLCKLRIAERDAELQRSQHKRTQKRVIYRVLQSSANELTQMISTLSESWRLEQILSLSSADIAGTTHGNQLNGGVHGNEYLVVVSQEQDYGVAQQGAGGLAGGDVTFSNCNDKVKALSGSLSAHTITNLYR